MNERRRLQKRSIPLVVVPFMTGAGRRACEAAAVSWFDLSGNAHIVASGLRIIVDGRPDRFRSPGRPVSAFAPTSARVVRWLLMNPAQSFTQREIALATNMTEGFVSRIVARLEADHYVDRVGTSQEDAGRGTTASRRRRTSIRVRDAALLLDAWRDDYRFAKHTILRGHVAARSGDALARFVGDVLVAEKQKHAATALAAAWQWCRFGAFRTATFFLENAPSAELIEKLGFREGERGANLWLVVPNDAGVFLGADLREGIHCVHPVQAYLDLKEHPERATEAADRLRMEWINRRPNVG